MNAPKLTYISHGNGEYRVFGPQFFADVRMFWNPLLNEWQCTVLTCNNHMVNAWDVALWCERNIN